MMIKTSQEFYKKSFSSGTMKDAYMIAVKWFSTNVLSKAELKNVQVEFEKSEQNQSPTITVHLFAVIDDEKEIFAKHCECCAEMHKSFFINENNNCNICAAKGYHNRLEKQIKIKKEYYREMLKKYGGMN